MLMGDDNTSANKFNQIHMVDPARLKLNSIAMYQYNNYINQSIDCIDYITYGTYFGGYVKSVRTVYNDIEKQLLYLQYIPNQQVIQCIDKTDDINATDILLSININNLVRCHGQHLIANNLLYRNVYSIQLITAQHEIHICTHDITAYKQWRGGIEKLIQHINTHKCAVSSIVPLIITKQLSTDTTLYEKQSNSMDVDHMRSNTDITNQLSIGTNCNVIIDTRHSTAQYINTTILYHKYSRQYKNGTLLFYLPVDDSKSLLSILLDSITDVYVGCYSNKLNDMIQQSSITLTTKSRIIHIEFNTQLIRDNWLRGLHAILVNSGRVVSRVTEM